MFFILQIISTASAGSFHFKGEKQFLGILLHYRLGLWHFRAFSNISQDISFKPDSVYISKH